MDRQHTGFAAWQLRDYWEVTIHFCSTIALADALAHPMADGVNRELAKRLLKWNGLSISNWHNLTMEAIAPHKAHIKSNTLATSGRAIPELVNVFHANHIKLSKVSLAIQGHGESFVNWRNRVFGHGVFKNDEQWYADQTMEKLEGLHQFLSFITALLTGPAFAISILRTVRGTVTLTQALLWAGTGFLISGFVVWAYGRWIRHQIGES